MSKTADESSPQEPQSAVVGVRPWLPWPLSRMRWWTEPVPAERLAALRIVMSALMLLDIVFVYLPNNRVFFGKDSLGRPEVFQYLYKPYWDWKAAGNDVEFLREDLEKESPFHRSLESSWRWSLLYRVEDHRVIQAAIIVWIVATVLLLVGAGTRVAAVVGWLISTSFANINTFIDNGGDQIRYIVTLYFMLTPCGAVWSIDAWVLRLIGRLTWVRRLFGRRTGPVFIYPWALRLLFVQMVLMYWCNGLYKATGIDWWAGDSLYYVLNDLTLSRWPYVRFPIPYWLTRVLSWTVLIWELGFPLWVIPPWRRIGNALERIGLRWRWLLSFIRNLPAIALVFGAFFHVGIGLSMELGFFAPYVLCLYLPLLPFERLSSRHRLK